MLVSLIIPTYKPKPYLWICLDSVVSQTFSKSLFEVIIVLNGCGNPWKSEIEEYIARNMHGVNVVFITTMLAGVSNARNVALDVAKGDYIMFLDDDDFISPFYIENLYRCSSENTIGLCYPLQFYDGSTDYSPYYITNDYVKFSQHSRLPYYKASRYFGGPVYKMIHKNIIGNRRFDPRFKNGEDSLFMFLISDRYKYVAVTSKDAIYYRRIREGSATQNKKSLMSIVSNRLLLIKELSMIYWGNIRGYNVFFYISFVLGSIKALIYSFLKNHSIFKQI